MEEYVVIDWNKHIDYDPQYEIVSSDDEVLKEGSYYRIVYSGTKKDCEWFNYEWSKTIIDNMV